MVTISGRWDYGLFLFPSSDFHLFQYLGITTRIISHQKVSNVSFFMAIDAKFGHLVKVGSCKLFTIKVNFPLC